MSEYLAPGVYVEEVSFRSKSIQGVGTSVAGLVGPMRSGPLRGRPELMTSYADFVRVYGDASDLNLGGSSVLNHSAIAAKAFFDGGGSKLYVSRIAEGVNTSDANSAGSSASFSSTSDSNNHVTFSSRFPGAMGDFTLEFRWRDSENLLKVETVAPPSTDELLFMEATGLGLDVRDASVDDTTDAPDARFPINVRGLVRRVGANYVLDGNRCEIETDDGETLTAAQMQGILVAAGVVNDADSSVSFTRVSVKNPVSGDLSPGTSAILSLNSSADISAFTGDSHWGPLTSLHGALTESVLAGGIDQFVIDNNDLNPGVTSTITVPLAALAALGGSIVVQRNFDIDVRRNGQDGEVFYSYSNISTANSGETSLSAKLPATPEKREAQLSSPISCTLGAGVTGDNIFDALFELFNDDAMSPAPPSVAGPRYLISLTGGSDGNVPVAADYGGEVDEVNGNTGLAAFEDIEDIAMVITPAAAAHAASHQAVVVEVQKHCRKMRYRVGIVDAQEGMSLSEVRNFRSNFDDSRLALYYPWVVVSDPTGARESLSCPPSGFIAGVYANTDVQRGVHKPPANEPVIGALRFAQDINRFQQEVLNPEGINCLRSFPGRGHRVWGGRTLSSDPEWNYINVRRYFLYLERSIEKSTQWIVFEPNGERLWRDVTSTIENFLYNEWHGGKLLGPTPKHAYFVRCDRSTMTQADLDEGRLVAELGVAALKPAEFVIFRIGQKTADA